MKTVHLFRPVGLKELKLIEQANWSGFPPRLPEQPIFYPVLTFQYAKDIVELWNVNEAVADYAGVVTRFDIDAEYVAQFPVELAGGEQLQELWVPSEQLEVFNSHIQGEIQKVAVFYGPSYQGPLIKTEVAPDLSDSGLFKDNAAFVKTEEAYQDWLKKRL